MTKILAIGKTREGLSHLGQIATASKTQAEAAKALGFTVHRFY